MWSKRSSGRGSSAQTHLSSLRGFLQPGHISRSAWVATIRKLTKSAVLATSMITGSVSMQGFATFRRVMGKIPSLHAERASAVRYWKTGIWSACTIDSPSKQSCIWCRTNAAPKRQGSSSSSLPSFLPLAARRRSGSKSCAATAERGAETRRSPLEQSTNNRRQPWLWRGAWEDRLGSAGVSLNP